MSKVHKQVDQLDIYYQNVMGLSPNRDLLLQMISEHRFDIICLVETHLIDLDVEAARLIKQCGYVKIKIAATKSASKGRNK